MSGVAYIVYNKRSCVTGKALFDELKERKVGGYTWRRRMKPSKRFQLQPNLIIRWGNSLIPEREGAVEINNREGVRRASDKGQMMKILSSSQDVPTPQVIFFDENGRERLDELRDQEGKAFFRNTHDQVRYRSNPIEGDKYALRHVKKNREFRVHIFENKTIGIYEKIPEDSEQRIYKNDNSTFKRLDMSNENIRKDLIGIRPICRAAVKELGLDFGGVDVLMEGTGQRAKLFINEVNSSPALNEPNVKRWVDEIEKKIEKLNESSQSPRES